MPINLTDLTGSNGFVIIGNAASEVDGVCVASAGMQTATAWAA